MGTMSEDVIEERRVRLRADCASCVGLCCVAPAFAKSADFGLNKPAGQPCPNLRDDYGCGIHDRLRPAGFPGCAVFDCFGAGQHLTQHTYAGRTWRSEPGSARIMFAAFATMRNLHELLWYVSEAVALPAAAAVRADLESAYAELSALSDRDGDFLAGLDVMPIRARTNELLSRASELARAHLDGPAMRGANLIGAGLRGARLSGANLRGAALIGADLRRADLAGADLTGADMRGADLRGADLTGALFLTQAQLDAARGDHATRIDESLVRPSHWS